MRTPVILVAGQIDADPVVGALLRTPGTLVVEHRFDGHVVRRTMVTLQRGVLTTAENGVELAHGCVSCTIRNDLLVLLRQLHRRDDDELRSPPDWMHYNDPFGDWHEDPCAALADDAEGTPAHDAREADRG